MAERAPTIPDDLELVVVLADPRLPNPYHPSGVQDDHDRRDVARLTEVLDASIGAGSVTYLDDHDRLIDELRARSPDLVLNFCNAGYGNVPELQMHVAALLEVTGARFAGADAACLALCHDKAAVHAAAESLDIPVARQELLRLRAHASELPRRYPAILKPNDGSGSDGITAGSLVHGADEAARRMRELSRSRRPPKWVVSEEFLPGREFSVAVLERDGAPTCLRPLEIDYRRLPTELPKIMTHDSKADERSEHWKGVDLREAELSDALRADVERHCTRMFDRLGCRDYARFDLRCDQDGVPRLIDANAHPEWGAEGMMATMAGFSGLRYEDLIARIVASALRRPAPVAPPRRDRAAPEVVTRVDGLRLRRTTPGDIAFVREVESAADNRAFIEQWSEAEHQSRLNAEHTRHLILEDAAGDAVGYAILEGLSRPDDAILLRRIVVTKKREGIGGRAMRAIERYCFETLGLARLWLDVDAENAAARRLYERRGFSVERYHTMVQMALNERDYRNRARRADEHAPTEA